MLRNYLTIAWRNISRHKGYALINISGLSLGVCACIVIFLVTHYELSFDTFHPDKGRIFRVVSHTKMSDGVMMSARVAPAAPGAIREEIAGLEAVTDIIPFETRATIRDATGKQTDYNYAIEGTNDQTSIIITDPAYFSVFKYEWLAGNPATAVQQPFTVVLSEDKARRYFGPLAPADMLGKEVVYGDSLRVTVSGIVKDWHKNTNLPFTDFISFSTIKSSFLQQGPTFRTDEWHMGKGAMWIWCFVKLSKGASPAGVNPQFSGLLKTHLGPEEAAKASLRLQSLSDIHFNSDYPADNIRKAHLPTLYGLMGIAGFILLIAAINFINLSTALSIRRAKEIGVRKVLGSGRGSLIIQFLTETFVLTFIAVGIALLLVNPVLRLFRDFIPEGVRFTLFSSSTIGFILLIVLVTSLLAGFYPAKVLSSYLPVLSLKGAAAQKNSGSWNLRKGLIVFQFSISLIFIIATLVVGRQIRFMLDSDFGFKTDAVITVNPDWDRGPGKVKGFMQNLRQLPGIDQVILEGIQPMGFRHLLFNTVQFKGKNEREIGILPETGDEDFIPFYGMHLVAGRNLLHSDSLTELVVNEACVQAMGFTHPEDALGKFLYWYQKPYPIVGVVADFHEGSFHETIKPLFIGHIPRFERTIGIRLASRGMQAGQVRTLLAGIESEWKKAAPGSSLDYEFLDDSIAAFYDSERKTATLMQTSMVITIFISCMGLFGLAMFAARQRTKEIAIRKVLGAGMTHIVGLLSRDFLLLVLLALLIASPIAWLLMNRWLQGFEYRIPVSWWIFPLAGACAIGITLLTISFESVKAAVANPVKSLRAE